MEPDERAGDFQSITVLESADIIQQALHAPSPCIDFFSLVRYPVELDLTVGSDTSGTVHFRWLIGDDPFRLHLDGLRDRKLL